MQYSWILTTEDILFVYKHFGKKDKVLFFIVRILYLLSSISSSTFHGSILSEFLQIAGCTLRRQILWITATVDYRWIRASILRQIKKAFQRNPERFAKLFKIVLQYKWQNNQPNNYVLTFNNSNRMKKIVYVYVCINVCLYIYMYRFIISMK